MSKKMKIPSFFKTTVLEAKQPWQWPSCNNPKTLSFRASNGDNIFKTVNSVFLDPSDGLETPESWFTNSSECASFSTNEISDDNNNTSTDALETIIREVKSSERLFFKPGDTSSISEDHNNNNKTSEDAVEVIIQGVKLSERLFFEPGYTSSILNEAKPTTNHDDLPFKESVALALESDDPYLDFKKSMQEMVESNGLKDWDCLEELLGWYLKMNGKMNHGFIVGAFVDLLIGLASNNSTTNSEPLATPSARRVCCSSDSTSTSYSSADSSFSSSPPPSPSPSSSPLSPIRL